MPEKFAHDLPRLDQEPSNLHKLILINPQPYLKILLQTNYEALIFFQAAKVIPFVTNSQNPGSLIFNIKYLQIKYF